VARTLIIRNACVYDPLAGTDGEVMDLCCRDGRMVDDVKERDALELDAGGRVTMAGGVDIHSHIAGSKVNRARCLRPEDSSHQVRNHDPVAGIGAGSGLTVPSTRLTGALYAEMGYTTVIEPAMAPLKGRHTHEELADTPLLDTGALVLAGNHHRLLEYIRDGHEELVAPWCAWLIHATRALGLKVVNPAGNAAWEWAKNVNALDEPTPHFGVTAAEVLTNLQNAVAVLKLPHPIHVHLNNLGIPGNADITIESLRLLGKNGQAHVTHLQFHTYGGGSWKDFSSRAEEVAGELSQHPGLTTDIGQVMFGDTTTLTADGPAEWHLGRINRLKWVNTDVERETGGGIVPYVYRPTSGVNAIQWAAGLELALLIDDPWRVFLTTDAPNGCPFARYPDIMTLLASQKARERALDDVHERASSATTLPSLDREYSLSELAIMTRAGTAKRLGLGTKGGLSPGMDADIAVYDFLPDDVNDPKKLRQGLGRAFLTVKSGEVVVRDGRVVTTVPGSTLFTRPKYDDEAVREDRVAFFKDHSTITEANYTVQEDYLPHPREVPCC